MSELGDWLEKAVRANQQWMAEFGTFHPHDGLAVSPDQLTTAFNELTDRLRDNYPFGHPRYIGQMLKPPHPAAVIGYISAMLINPNNHALDGGPATAQMEKEVVVDLARMFGFADHLGHLTSSGTIANLEALWVARESHPGKAIAYSADAHYTHSRMCGLLGVEGIAVDTDSAGRMDLAALEQVLSSRSVGTIVATLGTTGLGALDPLPEILELARQYGARVHVDSAYGGFFRLIADDSIDGVAAAPYLAIAQADSIVVDPHKHGLQPYGCGAVLFSDPTLGRFYVHDSPYTYFSSSELHLGEISLECSRAGAAAAALWMTMKVLPFTADGLGEALRANRRGALEFSELLAADSKFNIYQEPELDIVTFFPSGNSLSEVDSRTVEVFNRAAALPPTEQVHLATFSAKPAAFAARGHNFAVDSDLPSARILRSTIMKPESSLVIPDIYRTLVEIVRDF